jgi:hypothetical protein
MKKMFNFSNQEMQIKAIMSYHLTHYDSYYQTKNHKWRREYWKSRIHVSRTAKWHNHHGKPCMESPPKLYSKN